MYILVHITSLFFFLRELSLLVLLLFINLNTFFIKTIFLPLAMFAFFLLIYFFFKVFFKVIVRYNLLFYKVILTHVQTLFYFNLSSILISLLKILVKLNINFLKLFVLIYYALSLIFIYNFNYLILICIEFNLYLSYLKRYHLFILISLIGNFYTLVFSNLNTLFDGCSYIISSGRVLSYSVNLQNYLNNVLLCHSTLIYLCLSLITFNLLFCIFICSFKSFILLFSNFSFNGKISYFFFATSFVAHVMLAYFFIFSALFNFFILFTS